MRNGLTSFLVPTLLASILVSTIGCGGGADMTVISTTDYGHAHRITITSAQMSSTETITLTTTPAGDPSHTHTARLTKHDLQDVNDGRVVFIVTSKAPDATHTPSTS